MQNTMVPLTVANTLDQSTKERIEAQSQQTVKQAIMDAKMAPKGQFDVFDNLGKVVSNKTVDQFRDKTIYIGVQKVAGGAIQFDDDWGDGVDLDDIDELPRKIITFINLAGVRQKIEPQGNETLIQAAERVGLRPRDGSPIEVRDIDNDLVSNRSARDMVGRSFRVNPRAIKSGGRRYQKIKTHTPIVPKEIIEQTTAFTAPRGRLEMGGLLVGHVNEKGENVVVCGFFPEQLEATSGYCEFEGGFVAMAAAACDMANERCGGPHTPNLRVIGWIHTHPDIGIFLSGIDIRTFTNLRDMSHDGRCVAVVVDPLRQEHGVFRSPKSATSGDSEIANKQIKLSEDLLARYHKFIDRMRFMQIKEGNDRIPMIMPGILRRERIAMGDVDDIETSNSQAMSKVQRDINVLERVVKQSKAKFSSAQAFITSSNQRIITLERAISKAVTDQKVETNKLGERIQALIESQKNLDKKSSFEVKQLSEQIQTLNDYQKSLKESSIVLLSNQEKLEQQFNVLAKKITTKITTSNSRTLRLVKNDAKEESMKINARVANLEQQIIELRESKRLVLIPSIDNSNNLMENETLENLNALAADTNIIPQEVI